MFVQGLNTVPAGISGFSWPHDSIVAWLPQFQASCPCSRLEEGRECASQKCPFIRKAKAFSEALKRLLGLIGLNLVRWTCLTTNEAGEVGTQLFQSPECQQDLPADNVHPLSPPLTTLPWFVDPEIPVLWICSALPGYSSCCAAMGWRYREKKGLYSTHAGSAWHRQD